MLGSELIDLIESKYLQKQGASWEDWLEKKKDVYPDHEYPLHSLQITGRNLIKMIAEEKLKILMKDVC